MGSDNLDIVGFIDLLGTKESARVSLRGGAADPEEHFRVMLTDFFTVLALLARDYLRKSLELYIFGDCAYFGGSLSESEFIEFCRRLRADLLGRRIFFKCAITQGQLESFEAVKENRVPEDRIGVWRKLKELEDNSPHISVQYFGIASVHAYFLQEVFKGTGFVLDEKLARRLKETGDIVETFFPSAVQESGIARCFDVSFDGVVVERLIADKDPHQVPLEIEDDEQEVEESITGRMRGGSADLVEIFRLAYGLQGSSDGHAHLVRVLRSVSNNDQPAPLVPPPSVFAENRGGDDQLRHVLRARHISALKKEEYAAYYTPVLITMIKSSDFRWIYCDARHWNYHPLVFEELFLRPGDGRRGMHYIGDDALVLALADSVLRSLTIREAMLADIASAMEQGIEVGAPYDQIDSAIECTEYTVRHFVQSLMAHSDFVGALRKPAARVILDPSSADKLREIASELEW